LSASLLTALAALAAAVLPCAASHAQTVHKCTVDGKVTYTEQPCQAGTAAVIAVPEAPAANPEAAAELKRMRKEANTLERERHKREALDDRAQQQAARAAQARNKQCAKLRLEKKWADDDVRGALVHNLDRAKTRAQRAADRLALECPG
jgi:hypothetical protein